MKKWPILAALAGILWFSASAASADHSWGSYHWARTSNPFTLKLGDNVGASWDSYLATASADWTASSVLDTAVVAGGAGNPKRCRATLGRVEVCNSAYGSNGWLGIAQVWAYADGHVAQGVVKMNDTYFNTSTYNTPAWRRLVICQEVGHTLGLDHQDEVFGNTNLGTCMDYTNNPAGPLSNEHPNAHDYAQLETIYGHLDSTTTVKASAAGRATFQADAHGSGEEEDWGEPVKRDERGRPILHKTPLPDGGARYTWVVWTDHGKPNKP